MVLYTCGLGGTGPPILHPCSTAVTALDKAGYTYELRQVGSYRLLPWTWGSRSKDRAEVKRLSGTHEVPILVLDGGEVISGSSHIAGWARAHPQAPSEGAS